MSSGHKTSAVPRPKSVARATDPGRFADFTRPIAQGRRLVRTRRGRVLLGFLAFSVIAALLGALFVLPVKAWLQQEDDLTSKQAELAVLEGARSKLEAEVEHLRTEDGAMEAARDELGVVAPGEIRISMLDLPNAPAALPTGWPYDAVIQIVATRAALAAGPPTTTAP